MREHRHAIAKSGGLDSVVRRVDDLKSIDGLIIPGGESTTIGKLLNIFGLLEPLRQAITEGLPVFGTCAGMILLAKNVVDGSADQETLATMNITVRRNAFGSQVDSFESDLDLSSIKAGTVTGVFIRAPWIESAGERVEILATTSNYSGAHPILARQERQLVAAFHPEIVDADSYSVHEYFIRELAS